MRVDRFAAVAVALAALVAAVALPHAAAQEGAEPQLSSDMQAEMETWMKLAQPGEHHRHLAPFVGSWKGVVTSWMGPDTEPMVEEGTAQVSWILGDRFLEWKLQGNFGGMPFEGFSIEGYNNGNQRYESMWIDNFGTLILYYTGACSDDGARRKMETTFTDPMTGGTIFYRSEYSWVDPDHYTFTAFMDKGAGEFKNMEIRWARQ
jgi:hypothetical protein